MRLIFREELQHGQIVAGSSRRSAATRQLIYNIEYRVPIISVLSVAAFADIGTVFNVRKYDDQITSSNFVNSTVVPLARSYSGWRRDSQFAGRPGDV